MKAYVLARLGQSVVVLFGAVAISFVLTNVIGSPADALAVPWMTEEQRRALDAQLGYDLPVLPRFLHYVTGVVHGDFGISYRTNRGALQEVGTALPNTLLLVVCALTLAVGIALVLAVYSVRRRDSGSDRVLRGGIGLLQGMPDFWLALMLLLAFSVGLAWLPSFGFEQASSLLLPTLALSLPIVPILFRIFRGQLLDVLASDFVEAMRARGLSEPVIVYRHGLPNIASTSAALIAFQLGHLIAGDMIIESVFAWPGIGNLMISAVLARDFAVVECVIVVVAALYVGLNLLADLVQLWVDPRVRVGAA
ncbi:ABC transporter permease [Dactylosporangium roseum]|uniref:ABC transporter permease n=1 Tax=Dactylosporangium roseum TaxID=47989 RepID=A0ABY5YYJ3_9ACTN|nr:ABC transporter permease [Dactylosporangium roseum]UWZ34824.1 ABC transporter permease [Dactylosporangium roseum]